MKTEAPALSKIPVPYDSSGPAGPPGQGTSWPYRRSSIHGNGHP